MTGPHDPGPTIEPTSSRVVTVAVLAGAVGSWLVMSALDALEQPPVEVGGWTTPVLLAVAAAAGFSLAAVTRQRNQVLRRPVAAPQALLTLAVGKTLLLAGALLVGAYATIAVRSLPRFSAPGPRERVVIGGVAALVAAVLAVSGWLVERACRIPPDDKDVDADTDEKPPRP